MRQEKTSETSAESGDAENKGPEKATPPNNTPYSPNFLFALEENRHSSRVQSNENSASDSSKKETFPDFERKVT